MVVDASAPEDRARVGFATVALQPGGTEGVRLKVDALQPTLSLFVTETLKLTVLPGITIELWLGEKETDPAELKSLLQPYSVEDMIIWPVDRRVGDPKNKDPVMIEPAPIAN